MKFAHSFSEQLQSNEYPSEWLDAAIRYRQLKKCIKKVQRELAELGLTADMLKMLAEEKGAGSGTTAMGPINPVATTIPNSCTLVESPNDVEGGIILQRRGSHDSDSSAGSSSAEPEEFDEKEWLKKNQAPDTSSPEEGAEEKHRCQGITFSYWFDGTLQSFVPKLVLTVDSEDGGLPVNVNLAPETRRALEELVARQRQGLTTSAATSVVVVDDAKEEHAPPPAAASGADSDNAIEVGESHEEGNNDDYLPPLQAIPGVQRKRRDSQHQVLVPLSSDLEFFRTLTHEISLIDTLQSREEASINSHIVSLSDHITTVSKPSSLSRSSDLYSWREIFQLYTESGVFFSTRERDGHKQRTVEDVEEKIQRFRNEMEKRNVIKSFRNKKSAVLLGEFMGVNLEILRLLRFREINKTAMRKILKKFDKRTSLTASSSFPTFIASDPFLTSHLAKALCFTMHNHLLTIIPQLDDYLCPICSSISVKPVRLACSHVFCVRCLVKLQRENKRFCPICRGDVVLKADSSNLDIGLWNFLKHYFPKEAREKQAENEREVTLEQFKAVQSQGVNGIRPGCVVM